jgi:hypothetical protein
MPRAGWFRLDLVQTEVAEAFSYMSVMSVPGSGLVARTRSRRYCFTASVPQLLSPLLSGFPPDHR